MAGGTELYALRGNGGVGLAGVIGGDQPGDIHQHFGRGGFSSLRVRGHSLIVHARCDASDASLAQNLFGGIPLGRFGLRR